MHIRPSPAKSATLTPHAAQDGQLPARDAVGEPALAKRPVPLTFEQEVAQRVVGDESVEPPVTVEVDDRDAQCARAHLGEAGLGGCVAEAAGVVAVEGRVRGFERARPAVDSLAVGASAVQSSVDLGGPDAIAANEQIRIPVPAGVDPCQRAREAVERVEARRVGHVREVEVAVVPVESQHLIARDREVDVAVVIEVRGGVSLDVAALRQAHGRRAILEPRRTRAPEVLVEVDRGDRAAIGRVGRAVEQQDVWIAVEIRVEKAAAAGVGLRVEQLTPGARVVDVMEPHLGGDLDHHDGGGGAGRARRRRWRGDRRCGDRRGGDRRHRRALGRDPVGAGGEQADSNQADGDQPDGNRPGGRECQGDVVHRR